MTQHNSKETANHASVKDVELCSRTGTNDEDKEEEREEQYFGSICCKLTDDRNKRIKDRCTGTPVNGNSYWIPTAERRR